MPTDTQQRFTVYLDGDAAKAVRRQARSRSQSVSAYFKSLAAEDLTADAKRVDLAASRLGYLTIAIDFILDHVEIIPLIDLPRLQQVTDPPGALRTRAKAMHRSRLKGAGHAD